MQDKTRRINIKIKADSASKILTALGQSDITVSMDIPDNKDTYKTLSREEGIIDWDFVDLEKEEEEKNITLKKDDFEAIKIKDTNEAAGISDAEVVEFAKLYKEFGLVNNKLISVIVKDSQDLALLVESIWRVSKEKPGVMFGTNLFDRLVCSKLSEIRSQALNLHLNTERAMVKLLLEVYYGLPNSDIEVAFSDTLEKIKDHISLIKEADTLNKVANILYRYERER
jgi:hypothetical protein